LESIEALIDRLISGFTLLPKEEPSLTVLRALFPRVLLPKSKRADVLHRRLAQGAIFLKNDYAALPSIYQRRVETALTKRRRRPEFDAAYVCEAIASALDGEEESAAHNLIADLITSYVSEVGLIWLRRGLRPGRAVNQLKRDYRGPFHRFGDFVLTDVLEPWSKRHDGDQSETAAKLRKAHDRIPKQDRKYVRAALRRSDVEWLVGENHLRAALQLIKKTTPRTP
jgi:hypothetical protein